MLEIGMGGRACRVAALALIVLGAAGCPLTFQARPHDSGPTARSDAAAVRDAARGDLGSSELDAATRGRDAASDGSESADAERRDAGPDTGSIDDGAFPDATPEDALPPDAAPASADSGPPDTGIQDAAPAMDASAPDATTDCAHLIPMTGMSFTFPVTGFTPSATHTPPLVVSTTCTFNGSAFAEPPCPALQPGSIDSVAGGHVLHLDSLHVAPSGSLAAARGGGFVIFAVYGDAVIEGQVDMSAHGSEDGPGAEFACSPGLPGASGARVTSTGGGSGGGGAGGLHGIGGNGGDADLGGGGAPGAQSPADQFPNSGCRGGPGGNNAAMDPSPLGGGGGGLAQVSAAGSIHLCGGIFAAGGGGREGEADPMGGTGGGGGGSGGSIRLEAQSIYLYSGSMLLAGGGSGGSGGGHAVSSPSTEGNPGLDGSRSAAANQPMTPSPALAGQGGCSDVMSCINGTPSSQASGAGGGGGGGAAGGIYTNTQSCTIDAAAIVYPRPFICAGNSCCM